MIAWFEAAWPAVPQVRAVTTLRRGLGMSQAPFDHFNLGLRCGDDPVIVMANRDVLQEALGLPSAPRWLRQVHGIGVVRDPGAGDEPEADAAVTGRPGLVLAILTADCLPVVFAARDGREIAVAHAGWRGLAAGVLEQTLASMATPATALQAWLGPCAGPQRYEVGVEVRDAFSGVAGMAESAFRPTRSGHWHMDLPALARHRLLAAGMQAQAIHASGACTISQTDRFFSHRRDQRTGRMATLAWIAS